MIYKKLLSGAEALAYILKKEQVKYIFAYPGTSELALCDAILKVPELKLINGRGDKESAFMAAGGSLLRPSHAVAILHGARGLTNAVGALADARRNEIGTVFFVGLPSTNSAPFLPPHGEINLIANVGSFAKYYDEIDEVVEKNDNTQETERKAMVFIQKVTQVITKSRSLPIGPSILGIPQDVAENHWIPSSIIDKYIVDSTEGTDFSKEDMDKAIQLIKNSNNPVIFADDFLYKQPKAKQILMNFAEVVDAPVFQVYYGRGPMLFEQSSSKYNPYYVGNYTPNNEIHKKIMDRADLLITLEDRNMYSRVVGHLPECKKIAITSNTSMTEKNKYLRKDDIILAGDVGSYMEYISSHAGIKSDRNRLKKLCSEIREKSQETYEIQPEYVYMRRCISQELATIFKKVAQPILVDDSQMFGGLLAEHYEMFPEKLRVFGDHGAFIGGGLAYATGLAQCEPFVKVFNTLGDQSFTNAVQGLIAAVQEKANIIYIVCNNGKSVSLFKQILSQDTSSFEGGKNKFLYNAPYHYARLTQSIGIQSYEISFIATTKNKIDDACGKLRKILSTAVQAEGPVFIELKLPSDFAAWEGIWAIKGNEK